MASQRLHEQYGSPVLFTFYIQGVQKLKKKYSAKGLNAAL